MPLPKFYDVCSRDTLRPSMTYGVVYRDRMVCTDAHVLSVSHVSNWVEDSHILSDDFQPLMAEDQIKNVNGRMFSRELLQKLSMAKYHHIRFEADLIYTFDKKKKLLDTFHYSGISFAKLKERQQLTHTYNKFLKGNLENRFQMQTSDGELVFYEEGGKQFPDSFAYPDWVAVMGNFLDKETLNLKEFPDNRSQKHFIGIHPKHLLRATNIFKNPDFGAKVFLPEVPNRPYFIVPVVRNVEDTTMPYGEEFSMLMPILTLI